MSSKPWVLGFCTVPNKEVLPEIHELGSQVEGFLGELADLIREHVNFGSHVFVWVRDEVSRITDPEEGTAWAAAMAQFRSGLDTLAAVEPQVRGGCCDAARITLRSLLEVRLSLTYLLQDSRIDRAHAFLVCDQFRRVSFLEMLDPEHPRGKEHLQHLKEEKLELNLPKSLEEIRSEAQSITKMLSDSTSPAARRAVEEYKRLVSPKGPPPHWYSFHGGPKNMRRLASDLKCGGTYDILYGSWSAAVHSSEPLSRMKPVGNIGVLFDQLRHPGAAQEITAHACRQALFVIPLMLKTFAPSRLPNYQAWYSHIRQAVLFVSSHEKVLYEPPR